MSAFTDEDYQRVLNERDEWRDKFLALNQTAGELCNACGWAFKIPGESCRCEVIKERDEALAEVERLREMAHDFEAMREDRDEARAERDAAIARITEVGVMIATNGNRLAKDAYRRGAEAMREACAEACWSVPPDAHPSDCAFAVNALPIPEEP